MERDSPQESAYRFGGLLDRLEMGSCTEGTLGIDRIMYPQTDHLAPRNQNRFSPVFQPDAARTYDGFYLLSETNGSAPFMLPVISYAEAYLHFSQPYPFLLPLPPSLVRASISPLSPFCKILLTIVSITRTSQLY